MRDDFGLAGLEGLGDPDALRSRAEAAIADLDPDLRPGAFQEGSDASHSVWVTVASDGNVVDVTISRQWTDQLPAERLGDAVLAAYQHGNQKRAAAIAHARAAASTSDVEAVEAHESGGPDIGDERRLDWVWASLEQARRRLDDLNSGRVSAPAEERTVHGPAGYVRLRATGPTVTAVLVDAPHVAKRSPDAVAVDLRAAFAAAQADAPG